jgi:hypothetical protein
MKPLLKYDQAAVIFDNYALRGAHDILVREDGIAFVAGKFGSFAIVDVRNPLEPKVRGYFGASEFNEAQTVFVRDDYCFLGGNWFCSIDVSDMDRPVVRKRIHSPEMYQINGFASCGNYLFGASKHGYINVFDISKPDDPVHVGSFNAKADAGFVMPHDIGMVNDECCIIVSCEPRKEEGIFNRVGIYRCIDKEQKKVLPFDQWELVAKSDEALEVGANRVLVHKNYAYVACHRGRRVIIYDISNPALIQKVAVFDTTGTTPCGIKIDESADILYVGAEDSVQVVSIKDPHNPVTLSDQRYPEMFPSNASHTNIPAWLASNAHDMDIYNGYLFVTGQFDNCLGVIKI